MRPNNAQLYTSGCAMLSYRQTDRRIAALHNALVCGLPHRKVDKLAVDRRRYCQQKDRRRSSVHRCRAKLTRRCDDRRAAKEARPYFWRNLNLTV